MYYTVFCFQSHIFIIIHRKTRPYLTLSLPLATIVDTVPVPLATKVDRTLSVPLAMIVAVFTNVRGIACFQIFYPRNPALGARKSAAKELRGRFTGSPPPEMLTIFFNKYLRELCHLRCITKRRNCCHQIRFWAAKCPKMRLRPGPLSW